MRADFWRNRRVFVSGHTGFTGGWLTLWLQALGAECCGYSLEPPSTPNMYTLARVGDGIMSVHGDIRDAESLQNAVAGFSPEIVIHLAAQALVLKSFEDPVTTYTTNVIGTLNLLEAARRSGSVRAFVNITSDKCYQNLELARGYREDDRLGGSDPYSSSKACAEIASAAYRSSFLNQDGGNGASMAMATVRAGNIIGGGDWGRDRLIPDIARAFAGGETAIVRNPDSVRPWQHVLDALCGYLELAERLTDGGHAYAEAWNFGADPDLEIPVARIVEALQQRLGEALRCKLRADGGGRETRRLKLDSTKAMTRLGWRNRLPFAEAMDLIAGWYRACRDGEDMRALTLAQIRDYGIPEPAARP